MKRAWLCATVACVLALSVPALADEAPEEVLKAVVKIRAIVPKEAHTAASLGTERVGCGVLIDSKGLILTTGYLIVESEAIEVTGPEGRVVQAAFVGYDHTTGFGVLRTHTPLNVKPMKLGQSSKITEGDPVMVAGYGGVDEAIGARVIMRQDFVGSWEYILENAIYASPPIAEFGGAALIGPDGQLLGIGSLFAQLPILGVGSLPCNVFIPIDLLPPILDDLVTAGRPKKPARPWLGISAEAAHRRVFVTRVTNEGPAAQAGIQTDDLILKVNGRAVEGLADFYRKVWGLGNAGVEVTLSILKGTEIRDITLRSADRYKFLQQPPQKKTGGSVDATGKFRSRSSQVNPLTLCCFKHLVQEPAQPLRFRQGAAWPISKFAIISRARTIAE
jgi:S1-C subfamily serine protease